MVVKKAKKKVASSKKKSSAKSKSPAKKKVSKKVAKKAPVKKKVAKKVTKKAAKKVPAKKVVFKNVVKKAPTKAKTDNSKSKVPPASEAKSVYIKKMITTFADDILDVLGEFKSIKLTDLMNTMMFDCEIKGVPIRLAPCMSTFTRDDEFVAYKQIKKVKEKIKPETKKEDEVKEDKKDKKKDEKKVASKKVKKEKKPKYIVKEVITEIVVHKKGCKHQTHKDKAKQTKKIAKLGQPINVKPSKHFDLEEGEFERWVHYLEEHGAVDIHFPVNIFADITIKPKEFERKEKDIRNWDLSNLNKTQIGEYLVSKDGVTSKIILWEAPSENVGIYELIDSDMGYGTECILKGISKDLTNNIKINTEDITDPKKMLELRGTFKDTASKFLKELMPNLDSETFNHLVGSLVHRLYGLGSLEIIIGDDNLEEVAVNGSTQSISVYHRKYGWLKTTKFIKNENDVYNLSAQIGRKVGQQINSLNPIMDAHLLTGDRVASTIFPISTSGNTITIRRFTRSPWTLINFISPESHLFSKEIASLVWLCMQYELNVLVAGGTASGKTSVLNILSSMISPQNRILSIEDTREIQLPGALRWNWVPLTSKRPNPEGQGEVSMLDLIVAALRMRPDRIIVGEIRRAAQAQSLFEAMHTGHSVYATIHADTAPQVVQRLKQKPMEVPESELEALHLVLVQYRDRRTGKRRTKEVAEIIPSKDGVSLNFLYRWQPRTDRFEKVNESIRIFEEISLHTGMTPLEIQEDLDKKSDILQWMLDHENFDMDKIGEIFKFYYKDAEWLYSLIKDHSVDEVIEMTKSANFEIGVIKEKTLHYSKDEKEKIIEQFYKKYDVYNNENWILFLKTLDLSDPKMNDLLYKVKQEFEK